MKHALFAILVWLANLASTAAAEPGCPEGYWDLGEHAAVIAFRCESETDEAQLFFCERDILLKRGYCTGRKKPISCKQQEIEATWACQEEEGGQVRFNATIKRISDAQIHYHAKSHLNKVELIGTLIKLPE